MLQWDVMKIIVGVFLLGIVPSAIIFLQQKRKSLPIHIQRRGVYLLSLINLCGVLLWMGNGEAAFSILLGSSVFYLLVVQGIAGIQQKNSTAVTAGSFWRGMESSAMFLSISFIVLLLLCADYLFRGGQAHNMLEWTDGCILIGMGVVYFFLEGRRIGWSEIAGRLRKGLQGNLLKKILLLVLLEVCIFAGSCLLADGMLAVSMYASLLPYITSFLFLSWCVNLIHINLSPLHQNIAPESCNQDCIFSVTLLIGLCAVCRVLYISTWQIYDIILIALFSILIIPPYKIDSRILGCCKVTAYFVLVFYILFR